ncbi:MAG: YicC family protein [Candidatus Bipolaricaulota bacterium]|nr:YicC family protein [Candidatus Bipolaricaulota bacterium]MDW8031208.1 YicC/YloC family endoribonuclease [Candidatus Bipolaricaulota bacterium]
MTGYGYAQAQHPAGRVTVSVKTLNHKYLDLSVGGLEAYPALELKVHDLVGQHFARGHVEVQIEIERRMPLVISTETARAYGAALRQLAQDLQLSESLSLDTLLRLEGVLQRVEEPEPELWERLEPVLREALVQAQASRVREGQLLAEELLRFLALIEHELAEIEQSAPAIKKLYHERLRERVRELTENIVELDEGRLEMEVALWAERSDITEELARVKMHLRAAREAIAGPEPAGRLLDFLAQELAREANTISAKAKDAQITRCVLEMKALIERFREQVRNVE